MSIREHRLAATGGGPARPSLQNGHDRSFGEMNRWQCVHGARRSTHGSGHEMPRSWNFRRAGPSSRAHRPPRLERLFVERVSRFPSGIWPGHPRNLQKPEKMSWHAARSEPA
jgi:hypothetical protein